MYIVTGGSGFIGSNLVHELNGAGITRILVVDNLTGPAKFHNLRGAQFVDYMDKREFRRMINEDPLGFGEIEAVFHQGACSNTLENDGLYMMDNNFTYSKEVLTFSVRNNAPLVYASSAATYGLSGEGRFAELPENEAPLNIYGFSKLAFDNYVRDQFTIGALPTTVVGLRYFNAYGPRENHKGRMASVMHHFSKQIVEAGKVCLFKGSGRQRDGEQKRDFVYVRDLCRLNMFFAQVGAFAPRSSTIKTYHCIVNAGSGRARTFNDVAHSLMKIYGNTEIEYVPLPNDLNGRYQHFTEANLDRLRATGCDLSMTPLEEGIAETFLTMRTLQSDAAKTVATPSRPGTTSERETSVAPLSV